MLQNLIGAILKYIVGLLFVYIQTYPCKLVQTDTFNEVIGFYQCASGGVDQNDTVFHLTDGINVNHVIGGVHQGTMKGNDIALFQQSVQRNIFHEILQGRILVYIIGDDSHAKPVTDAAHGCTDFAGADDAGSFLIEIETHETAEAEVVFSYLIICFI